MRLRRFLKRNLEAILAGFVSAVITIIGFAAASKDPRVGAEVYIGLLGLLIVVVGWYTTTRLAADTQREFLHLQLLNESRQAIVVAIRAEETRLGSLSSIFSMLEYLSEVTPAVRTSTVEQSRALLSSHDGTHWIFALEERAALYPELRPCRIQMVLRQRKLHEEVHRLALVLSAPGQIDRHVLNVATELAHHAGEQASLMHDVLVHVQSRAFSTISGHEVERRTPPDDGVVRLVERDGALHVDVIDKAARARLKVGGWLPSHEL